MINERTNPNKHGDIAEARARAYLLEEGYEVFHNVSWNGDIDFVAIKGDEIKKIDVKIRSTSSGRSRSQAQIAQGVVLLNYDTATDSCYFVQHGY